MRLQQFVPGLRLSSRYMGGLEVEQSGARASHRAALTGAWSGASGACVCARAGPCNMECVASVRSARPGRQDARGILTPAQCSWDRQGVCVCVCACVEID